MQEDKSIKETLEIIRKALEEDDLNDINKDVLILNNKVNEDGTINIVNKNEINKEDIEKILENKIESFLEKKIDKFLDNKINKYIKKK